MAKNSHDPGSKRLTLAKANWIRIQVAKNSQDPGSKRLTLARARFRDMRWIFLVSTASLVGLNTSRSLTVSTQGCFLTHNTLVRYRYFHQCCRSSRGSRAATDQCIQFFTPTINIKEAVETRNHKIHPRTFVFI